jgi:tetratricopeptide (TPR) repeat protein
MSQQSTLSRLLGHLAADPGNPKLLADAAQAAYDAQDVILAAQLLGRIAEPLPAALYPLKALVALGNGRFAEAAELFEDLRKTSGDTPALRFNLAWSKAMQNDFEPVVVLLDEEALAASPRAPALMVHALHHLARYDEALASGQELAKRFPGNEELMGALATLALDVERPDLARRYGEHARSDPEGQAALGVLALGDHQTEQSLHLFEEALSRQPNNPRALVGKGLGLLASGRTAEGAATIDRGAELFRTHLGSWIAAGWAYFACGNPAAARARFERALAIDANFSESHGGLAVLDIAAGNLDEAKRRCEIALRLDRRCFGAALAKSMLLEREGRPGAAQKVREIAFSTQIGNSGRTLGEELQAFGLHLMAGATPRRLH